MSPGQSQRRDNGASVPAAVTSVDGDGYTTHPFILGVDALGNPAALLVVSGDSYDYLD